MGLSSTMHEKDPNRTIMPVGFLGVLLHGFFKVLSFLGFCYMGFSQFRVWVEPWKTL
jgi:hypothetical protein